MASLLRTAGSAVRSVGCHCDKRAAVGRFNVWTCSGAAVRQASSNSNTRNIEKRLKEEAEVVVIGGGALGCSIAYHLAKAGVRDVLLLEKSELTAGSTWHSAGVTSHYMPLISMKRLTFYSVELYKALEQETGQSVGFHKCGSLRICTSPERLDEARYQMQRHGWHQARQRLIYPDEIATIHPLMNVDDVLASLWFPDDGYLDPSSLCQAFAKGARMYGAEIYMPVPVTGLKSRSDGAWEVQTEHGTIKANHVINAAGFGGREVGRMAGMEIPLGVVRHQFVVTDTVPEVAELTHELPFVRDLDYRLYSRQERQGFLFGTYEEEDEMHLREEWWDKVPANFGKELFESDMDVLLPYIERSIKRIPVLAKADISSVVSGPITYSPDAMPILGPAPELPNMWMALGSGYGVGHAGGVGKFLTDWIITGEPPYELMDLDPGRFGNWTTKEYVMAKVRETYGMNNQCQHPRLERPAGRPIRTSAIYKRLVERGAEMGFRSGWEHPNWFALPGDEPGYKPSFRRTNWFEPVGRECDAVINRVGVIDLTSYGKFDVKGKDAAPFLDTMVANSLPEVGHTRTCFMSTPKGKVYAELAVSTLAPDCYFLVTSCASEFHDLRWLLEHARKGTYDVEIRNVTDHVATLGLAGPKSRDVLLKLTSVDLADQFKASAFQDLDICGLPVRAANFSCAGEIGWELYHQKEHTPELYEALLTAGQEYGIADVGVYALNTLRLQKGIRAWGTEMNMDFSLLESGLDVNFNKECSFIGKDALLKERKEGVKKCLCFVTVDTSDVDPQGNESVWCDGKVRGFTTSGAYSYQLKKGIAFAFLPVEFTETGRKLEVELLGNMCPATVVREPQLS